jgi:hypothetical protein
MPWYILSLQTEGHKADIYHVAGTPMPALTSRENNSHCPPASTNAPDIQELRSIVNEDPNVLGFLDTTTDWFVSWRDLAWVFKSHDSISLRNFVESRLSSNNPVIYAVGLLCIALTLQQLKSDQPDQLRALSSPLVKKIEQITKLVDQLIEANIGRDENMVLLCLQRAKLHAEGGEPRGSWLRIRQAIEVLNKSAFAIDTATTSDERLARQRWVGSIHEMDRLFSLILGFPHAHDESFTDRRAVFILRSAEKDVDLRMRAVRRIVAVAAEQVNHRNSGGQYKCSNTVTQKIQAGLDGAANAMPREWWQVSTHIDNGQAKVGHEHLTTQLWFWQVQAFLHLPHMLQADGDEISDIDRFLCLEGARRMLTIYCALRNKPELSVYLCSCDDFQGVLTACILLTGILLSCPHDVSGDYQLAKDFELLQDVKDILRYRAHQHANGISEQGLRAVEALEEFLMTEDNKTGSSLPCSIVLPYFEVINIRHRNRRHEDQVNLQVNHSVHPQPQQVAFGALDDHCTSRESILQGFETINFGQLFYGDDMSWSPIRQNESTVRDRDHAAHDFDVMDNIPIQ